MRVARGRGYAELPLPELVAAREVATDPAPIVAAEEVEKLILSGACVERMKPRPKSNKPKKRKGRRRKAG